MHYVAVISMFVLCLLLAGCGQKGALVKPGTQAATKIDTQVPVTIQPKAPPTDGG